MSTKLKIRWSQDLLSVTVGAVIVWEESIKELGPPPGPLAELAKWSTAFQNLVTKAFGVSLDELNAAVRSNWENTNPDFTKPQISLIDSELLNGIIDLADDCGATTGAILDNPKVNPLLKETIFECAKMIGTFKHAIGRAFPYEASIHPNVVELTDKVFKKFGFLPLSAEAAAS
jgi:hypothetical protein